MDQKFNQATFKSFLKVIGIALILSFVSVLPFLHDIITDTSIGVKDWVPNFGIENSLTDVSGNVRSFSTYRIFLYFLLLHVFSTIGWIGWATDAPKGKPYRFFLLIPSCMTFYTTLVILFDARASTFNNVNTKILLILVVNFLLMVFYFYRKSKQKVKL